MFDLFSSLGIFGLIFAGIIIVLWTLLPFAVFGIKDRLDQQIELLKSIESELRRINHFDRDV